MTKPARKPETMIMEVIYRFHPMFADEVPHLAGRYR
jgi:arginine deiminase